MIGLRIIALVAVAVACIVLLRAKPRRSRRIDDDERALESWEGEGGAVQVAE